MRLGEVERGNDLLVGQPLVDTELAVDVAALEDDEGLVELFPEFTLPLEGEVGRADDEDAFDQAAQLEFAHQQSGHDGLAGGPASSASRKRTLGSLRRCS